MSMGKKRVKSPPALITNNVLSIYDVSEHESTHIGEAVYDIYNSYGFAVDYGMADEEGSHFITRGGYYSIGLGLIGATEAGLNFKKINGDDMTLVLVAWLQNWHKELMSLDERLIEKIRKNTNKSAFLLTVVGEADTNRQFIYNLIVNLTMADAQIRGSRMGKRKHQYDGVNWLDLMSEIAAQEPTYYINSWENKQSLYEALYLVLKQIEPFINYKEEDTLQRLVEAKNNGEIEVEEYDLKIRDCLRQWGEFFIKEPEAYYQRFMLEEDVASLL